MKSAFLMCFASIVVLTTISISGVSSAQKVAPPAAQNPVPFIDQPLIPDAVAPGMSGFTVTVNGTGFVSASVVNWNGSPLATTFVSAAQLNASVPASDVFTPLTASVTVFNPGPGGGTSNPSFLEVTKATPAIFLVRSDYGATTNPFGVAVGDFNGDGKLDLAVADAGSSAVSIFLGNGDGTFQNHVDYPTGPAPIAVAVGDFNGDGKLDLAVADFDSLNPGISILLGNGDGTFQPHTDYPTLGQPYSVAVADFNGDGKLDLAAGNETITPVNTVSVLLGNGDGTFQASVEYVAGNNPNSVAVGDFNRDGKLDLVTTNESDFTISILLGNGDGTFQKHVDYGTSGAIAVAVADLNRDGNLDLAVASGGSTVGILLGNGDGTFQPHADYRTGNGPWAVAVADFNGDRNLDLALPNYLDNTLSVLLGNGDGTFQSHGDYPVLEAPNSVATGDFNQDGRLDMAVASLLNTSVLLQIPFVISPPSLNFGVQVVGTQSRAQSVQLKNDETTTVTLNSIAITGTDSGDFSLTNNCGPSLAPGASCRLKVLFKPAQLGPRTAAITVTDNAPGSPQTVPLSGVGVTSGPNVTLSPTSLTFATQLLGTSSTQSVMLSNYGSATLDITSVTTSGDFSYSSLCGSSVAPGTSCFFLVTFTPTQPGTRTGLLSITDNAPGSPQTVGLTGTGTEVTLIPTSLNFGSVAIGEESSLNTTLTNIGSTTMTITGITIVGADTSDFSQTNNCDGSLKGGASCTITVGFHPTQVGSRTADVSVSDNGGGSPQQVSLFGTGACGGNCFSGCKGTGCKCLAGRCLALGLADFLKDGPFEPNAFSAACGNQPLTSSGR